MSFSSLVDFFILKKTSLLLSVTLMLRCSVWAGASGRSAAGEPFSCCSDDIAGQQVGDELENEVVNEDRDEPVEIEYAEVEEQSDEVVSARRDRGPRRVWIDVGLHLSCVLWTLGGGDGEGDA